MQHPKSAQQEGRFWNRLGMVRRRTRRCLSLPKVPLPKVPLACVYLGTFGTLGTFVHPPRCRLHPLYTPKVPKKKIQGHGQVIHSFRVGQPQFSRRPICECMYAHSGRNTAVSRMLVVSMAGNGGYTQKDD
jgi:hypothetical protein